MTEAESDPSEPQPDATPASKFVQVALNLPLRREFTYVLPAGMSALPGNRVRVNFHGRKLGGVVTAVSDTTDLPIKKVKPIEDVLDSELSLPRQFEQRRRQRQHHSRQLDLCQLHSWNRPECRHNNRWGDRQRCRQCRYRFQQPAELGGADVCGNRRQRHTDL